MRGGEFCALLRQTPVIPAVKTRESLAKSLSRGGMIVFILFGDVMDISGIVSRVRDAGKLAFVHADLVEGLASRDIAVDFIAKNARADGVISTKPNLIRRAKALELLTVQRFFVLDSLSLQGIGKHFPLENADAVEILPGAMPKVVAKIASISSVPVIAGGLINDREDASAALAAGAVAVSTSNTELWPG